MKMVSSWQNADTKRWKSGPAPANKSADSAMALAITINALLRHSKDESDETAF